MCDPDVCCRCGGPRSATDRGSCDECRSRHSRWLGELRASVLKATGIDVEREMGRGNDVGWELFQHEAHWFDEGVSAEEAARQEADLLLLMGVTFRPLPPDSWGETLTAK
jgi:hypothetical protein